MKWGYIALVLIAALALASILAARRGGQPSKGSR